MNISSPEEVCPDLDPSGLSETLALAQSGDEHAFAHLVTTLTPVMRVWARRRYCRSAEALECVLQEAWLAAWAGIQVFRSHTHLRQWMYRVVRNIAVSRLRSLEVRQRAERALGERHAAAHDRAGAATTGVWLGNEHRALLDELPPTLRVVCDFYYVREFNVSEIAEALGLSRSAVKMRLHRARESLRETHDSQNASAPGHLVGGAFLALRLLSKCPDGAVWPSKSWRLAQGSRARLRAPPVAPRSRQRALARLPRTRLPLPTEGPRTALARNDLRWREGSSDLVGPALDADDQGSSWAVVARRSHHPSD